MCGWVREVEKEGIEVFSGFYEELLGIYIIYLCNNYPSSSLIFLVFSRFLALTLTTHTHTHNTRTMSKTTASNKPSAPTPPTKYYNDACVAHNIQAINFWYDPLDGGGMGVVVVVLSGDRYPSRFCSRSAFGAISGIGAGILGFTGFSGFLFYVVTSLWLSLLLYVVYARAGSGAGSGRTSNSSASGGSKVNRYFRSASDVLVDGIVGNALVGFCVRVHVIDLLCIIYPASTPFYACDCSPILTPITSPQLISPSPIPTPPVCVQSFVLFWTYVLFVLGVHSPSLTHSPTLTHETTHR